MEDNMKKIFLIYLALMPFTLLPIQSYGDEPVDINEMKGESIPLFNLTDIHDKKYKMKDHLGKVILVNFFYVGCKPCEMELPILNKIKKFLPADTFELTVINGLNQRPEEIKEFFRNIDVPELNAIIDSIGVQVKRFRVSRYPTSFLINKKGVIVEAFAGFPMGFEDNLSKRIEELINEE
jgi:thiol-disulfide isomerase/thioredoxin